MEKDRVMMAFSRAATRGNQASGFPTRSDTKWPVQSQKMARGWKFWIFNVGEHYYPCSGNKGADQLRSYCEADLRLCFCLGKTDFLMTRLKNYQKYFLQGFRRLKLHADVYSDVLSFS